MALGIDGVAVGCWDHPDHPTGCTVVLPPPGTLGGRAVRGGAAGGREPPGTLGGCAIRGGATGSRETPALSPTGSVEQCHAVLLTGGSAFGLSAADGVVGWCEANGRGLELEMATIPIVGAAVVYDLRRP